MICGVQFFQRDYFLLCQEFDIEKVAVTSSRNFAQREAVEIKVESLY